MTANARLPSGSDFWLDTVVNYAPSTARPHRPAKLAVTSPWSVDIFTGLFQPARTISIVAASQYEAECAAHTLLADDEWFPVFTAERTSPVLQASQPRHAHRNVHSTRPAVTQTHTKARGLRANEALSATQHHPTHCEMNQEHSDDPFHGTRSRPRRSPYSQL